MTLLELRQRFLAGLESRLSDLTAVVDGSADVEPLTRQFHSLVGIGGTYAYQRITDLSRECEDLCVVMEEHRRLTPAELQHIREAIAGIDACAQQY